MYILCAILLLCFNGNATENEGASIVSKLSSLKDIHCIPCEGGVEPLNKKQVEEYLQDFPEWKLLENPYKIERTFLFKNFIQAMAFVNSIAEVAEAEGHHPDITIIYNKVTIQLFTHAIQGLSANDFILADLIDTIFQQ